MRQNPLLGILKSIEMNFDPTQIKISYHKVVIKKLHLMV